jgi:hypothetical protein
MHGKEASLVDNVGLFYVLTGFCSLLPSIIESLTLKSSTMTGALISLQFSKFLLQGILKLYY